MIRTYSGSTPRIDPSCFIHDSSEVIGDVRIARNASVWPFAVLRGDVDGIRVGESTNIQDHTVIHARDGEPTVIGRGVTVGHRVIIHGARINDGCLIGMGAIIMEATIGRDCLIAAGALVPRGMRVPPRSLVLGVPARVKRKLTAAEIRQIRSSARDYVGYAKTHTRTSKVVFR